MGRCGYALGVVSLALFFVVSSAFNSRKMLQANGNGWIDGAHATFYGDMSGGETMKGACGYGNLFDQGYGLETTALSAALFNNGLTCGACYEIQCVNTQWCIRGSVRVTATNICPGGGLGWCDLPHQHFDLSMPMFIKLANYKAGIIPVQYRRVTCVKRGGLRFELSGNPYFLMVLVFNVGGAGDVTGMQIKGSNSGWMGMTRNWGQIWNISHRLDGQSLSFRVTTSNGRVVEVDNAVPSNWQFGRTYQGNRNF